MIQKNFHIKLKSLRKSQGVSLLQLANAIGKTKSYISMIENNKATPSISTLKQIASFFGLTLADFFEDEDNRLHINKEVFKLDDDARLIYSKKGEYNLYLLIDNPKLKMKTYLVELMPNGGYEQELKHEGEEQGYILEGKIQLSLDGVTHELEKDEYFYFNSSKKHKVKNISNKVAKIFWVYLP
ncbi:helix-turn-helix domain-containing protein [Deferribacteraceae bacterium V6Fe1]|nr:helix-turn-helix domain-containing protein [Deferribacteraceae bacterium V6Fe1]